MSYALGVGSAWAQDQPAQPSQQAQPSAEKKPDWKDRAEYDLVQSALKETDAKKKLDLLNQWKEKYPNTEFKETRLEYFVDTYQALNDPKQMLAAVRDLLTQYPKNLKGAYWACALVVSQNSTAPADLDLAQNAARTLLAAEKPAGASDDQWKQNKPQMDILAYRTLGWAAMKRNDFVEAEGQFTKELKMNPGDAQASYWLGTAIRGQQKPERQSEALYDFARAAAYDGPGALDPAGRKSIETYVQKAYTNYHGKDDQGFQQLLSTAKTNAFPPSDFKILSEAEVVGQKEQQLASTNPSLAFWLKLKSALTASDGVQYFDTGMKGALIPPAEHPLMTGVVISQEPARNPTKVVLGIEDPKVPEVTLKLDAPLPGRAEPGKTIQFRGVATGFTQQPFMVIFEVEKKNITGWPAPVPVHRPPVHRKAQ
jgi:tetratricopeptide (TPR) repeat protein